MVKCALVLLVALALTVAASVADVAGAQEKVYSVDHQWSQIFINDDGTIDLTYNVTVSVSQGTLTAFDLGQPNRDFEIGQAVDQYGNQLNKYKYTPDVASVDFNTPLNPGDSIWYMITTNVAGMISQDTTNPGNYGMIFIPQWIDNRPISDVRVQIVLPPGTSQNEIFYKEGNPWVGISMVEGRVAVYWEKSSIAAGERFTVGVSFPAQYLPNYTPSAGGFDIGGAGLILGAIGVLVAVFIFIFILVKLRKSTYNAPKVSMETLGVKRGFTAVEAAYLLDLKPPQLVTAILYSLLQKRAVWTTENKPVLKLKVLPPYENKTGSPENPLRYYEIDFLNALRADGTLDEERLAKTIMFIRDTVEQKMQGYNRKDTTEYYGKIVTKAWTQVEQAGTPELASNAYDEQLLWLMLDPNQRTRTETAFQNRPFMPNPLWFWWWYGYTVYHPHPTVQPNITAPSQSAKPPQMPGAEFANNIATAVESTSNNIVKNLEQFANAIVPPPPKASHQPARKGTDCVCACAACACACACVSCACACAGGGGR